MPRLARTKAAALAAVGEPDAAMNLLRRTQTTVREQGDQSHSGQSMSRSLASSAPWAATMRQSERRLIARTMAERLAATDPCRGPVRSFSAGQRSQPGTARATPAAEPGARAGVLDTAGAARWRRTSLPARAAAPSPISSSSVNVPSRPMSPTSCASSASHPGLALPPGWPTRRRARYVGTATDAPA